MGFKSLIILLPARAHDFARFGSRSRARPDARSIGGPRLFAILALAVIVLASWPRPAGAEGGPFEVYTVRPGDTLSAIAMALGVTTERLSELNRIEEPNRLAVGTVLVIARSAGDRALERQDAVVTSGGYRVRPDDTLSAIAARFETDVPTLVRMNRLANADDLQVGTTLDLPSALEAVAPPQEYVVEPGDTLTEIAARFGVPASKIAGDNRLPDLNRIRVGTVLLIPARGLPLPSPLVTQVVGETAADLDLDPYLLLALSYLESGWQMDVVSSTGAVGMMQLMPDTALWASRDLLGETLHWRSSLNDNTRLGSTYLRHLLALADGDVRTALAAYYQGWNSLQTEGMFEETEEYVDDILALVQRFRARMSLW